MRTVNLSMERYSAIEAECAQALAEFCDTLRPDVDADGTDVQVLDPWGCVLATIEPQPVTFTAARVTPEEDDYSRQYRAECIVELIWQACLTYDVESQRVRRLAETELALPYLRIETDYSPSDSARIATRVEALFETVGVREQST